MGKNRHCKDKLYIVSSEYVQDWGGYKDKKKNLPFRRLPFYCCALSLRPFTNPVATHEGLVFDAHSILPYLKQYGRNPVTGEPLAAKDLIPLRFHKNSDGEFHCPVTYKQFNDHSFIVANCKTGHVYSNEAIDALCRRPQSWLDLLTNEPFSSSDLITIQTPHNLDLRRIDDFDYVKKGIHINPQKLNVQGLPAEEDAFTPRMKETPIVTEIIEQAKCREEELTLKHKALFDPAPAQKDEEKVENGALKSGLSEGALKFLMGIENVSASSTSS